MSTRARLVSSAITAAAGASNVALLACDLIRYAQGDTAALWIAAANAAVAGGCFFVVWVSVPRVAMGLDAHFHLHQGGEENGAVAKVDSAPPTLSR